MSDELVEAPSSAAVVSSIEIPVLTDATMPSTYKDIKASVKSYMDAATSSALLVAWNVGKLCGELKKNAEYGDGVVEKMATEIGISSRLLYDMKKFYDNHTDVRNVLEMTIDWSAARVLGSVDNPTKRLELEKEVSEKGYTVAEVRKIVKELKAPAVKEKKKEEVKKATEERDTALRYFTRLRTSTGDILESLKHSLALKEKYVTMTETAEITSEEDFQEIVKILEDIAATGRRMNELLTRTVIPMSDLFTEEEEEAKSA
jgi:hypothetical protein